MWLDPLAACAPAHGMTSSALSRTHTDDADSLIVFACPLPNGGQLSIFSSGNVLLPPHSFLPLPVSSGHPAVIQSTGTSVQSFIARVRACFPHATTVARSADEPEHPALPVPHHVATSSHGHATVEVDASSLCILTSGEARARIPATLTPAFDRVYGGSSHAFLSHTTSTSTRVGVHIAVTHAAHASGGLWFPMRSYLDPSAPASDAEALYTPWGCSLYSIGTARVSDWRGGGKTPAEMYDDMRHRFASGSFKLLIAPQEEWGVVRQGAPFDCLKGLFPHTDEAAAAGTDTAVATGASAAVSDDADADVAVEEEERVYEMRTVGIRDAVIAERTKRARMEAARVMLPSLGCADVLRCKRVALGPNMDVVMMLDDGHVPLED